MVSLLSLSIALPAQDTLLFDNGNRIDGEIKGMQKNVLKVETDYSDDDFMIEWDKIDRIYTATYFFLYLTDGSRHYGWVRSLSDTSLAIISRNSMIHVCNNLEVLQMVELNQGFKDQFNANLDLGVGITKANSLKQMTIGAKMGYRDRKWEGTVSGNSLYSSQDSIEPTRRHDGNMQLRIILFRDWFLVPSWSYLSNTEQKLKLRSSTQVGFGKYLWRRYYGTLSMAAGANRNLETFFSDDPGRKTWEIYLVAQIDLFDVKDLDFDTGISGFRTLETNRWRVDYNIFVKYDLPLDFYVKVDFSLNYDSSPAEGADPFDYVSTLGFGWEW